MKTQHLFTFLLLILCFGCSKSDESDTERNTLEKQFIGVWKPLKFVIVCSTGNNEVENNGTCEQTGRLAINENGTWSETYFYDNNGICEDDGQSEGTWKIVNNKLTVTENGSNNIEITFFELTGNTLKIGQFDDDFPCDGNNMSSHFYNEYSKI